MLGCRVLKWCMLNACQVEEKKRGVAPGTPVAIQQHQDIIAANYPARAAGVKKHMRPAEVAPCMRRPDSIGCLLHAADAAVLHQHNRCAFANPDGAPHITLSTPQARRILHAASGMILPVHMEAGQRVSYGPYRAVSRAMIKLLGRWCLVLSLQYKQHHGGDACVDSLLTRRRYHRMAGASFTGIHCPVVHCSDVQ